MTFDGFLRAARADRRTLTLYGDVPDSTLADLRRFFDAMNVRVEVTAPGEGSGPDADANADTYPAGTAVLTEGDRVVETGSLAALVDYVEVDPSLSSADTEPPAIVEVADASVTAFEEERRRRLVRGSQVIEELGWQNRSGRLHAGFQTLSRLTSFRRTREVFRRLAEVGVDVHVYGVPDIDLPEDVPYTVHPRDDAETRRHWFVAYRCEETDECAALVARLLDEDGDEYEGFWTLDQDRARPIVDYVEETYAND